MLQSPFNWRNGSLRKVEYLFHAISIGVSLFVSIGARITGSYSTRGAFACFPLPQTRYCDIPAIVDNDPDMSAFYDPVQWANGWIAIHSGFQVATFPCSLLSMALITWQVFSQERRNEIRFVRSYSSDDLGPDTTIFSEDVYKKSRKVVIGSLLYIGSTFAVQLPFSIQNVLLKRFQLLS